MLRSNSTAGKRKGSPLEKAAATVDSSGEQKVEDKADLERGTIMWAFNDPKRRQQPPAVRPGAAKSVPVQRRDPRPGSSAKQVAGLLDLMQRGKEKQKQRHTEPDAVLLQLPPAPALMPFQGFQRQRRGGVRGDAGSGAAGAAGSCDSAAGSSRSVEGAADADPIAELVETLMAEGCAGGSSTERHPAPLAQAAAPAPAPTAPPAPAPEPAPAPMHVSPAPSLANAADTEAPAASVPRSAPPREVAAAPPDDTLPVQGAPKPDPRRETLEGTRLRPPAMALAAQGPLAMPLPTLAMPLPRRRQCIPAPPTHRPSVTSGLVLRTGFKQTAGGDVRWIEVLVDPCHSAAETQSAELAAGGDDGAHDCAGATSRLPPSLGADLLGVDQRLITGWSRADVLYAELHDEWRQTPVLPSDRINLVGELAWTTDSSGARCTVLTRSAGPWLVLRPEVLVTGTSLAQACTCARRTVFSKQFREADLGKNLVLGTMKHELFGRVLANWREQADAAATAAARSEGGAPDAPDAAAPTGKTPTAPPNAAATAAAASIRTDWPCAVREVLRSHLPELIALQLDERAVGRELHESLPTLCQWASDYLPPPAAVRVLPAAPVPTVPVAAAPPAAPAPMPPLGAQPLRCEMAPGDATSLTARTFSACGLGGGELRLSGVIGAEESLISTTYGLKGTVDAIVAVTLLDGRGGRIELPMPLELKTGQRTAYNTADHNAQLLVYTLLVSDLYETRVPSGLLWYPQLSKETSKQTHQSMWVVPAESGLLASLLMQRNILVGAAAPHALADGRLPPPLGDPHVCLRCPVAPNCTTVHAALEHGDASSFGARDVFTAHTAHLRAHHLEYVQHWLRLIDLEERSSAHLAREMIQLGALEREAAGRALGSLELVRVERVPTVAAAVAPPPRSAFAAEVVSPLNAPLVAPPNAAPRGATDRFVHIFRRARNSRCVAGGTCSSGNVGASLGAHLGAKSHEVSSGAALSAHLGAKSLEVSSGAALSDGPVAIGEYVTVSVAADEGGGRAPRWGLCNGTVTALSTTELALITDANLLDLGIEAVGPAVGVVVGASTGVRAGAAPSAAAATTPAPTTRPAPTTTPAPRLLRLDKADVASGFSICRSNVLGLLAPPRAPDASIPAVAAATTAAGAAEAAPAAPPAMPSRLLELLVDMQPPRFGSEAAALQALPAPERERLANTPLNAQQRRAVGRVLACEDYCLVLGMPGTGKSTLIAQAVRALVAAGQQVLLTAYTHSAVDTLCLKLLEEGVAFVRLGPVGKVHPDVRAHSLHALLDDSTLADQGMFEAELARRPVVAATAMGAQHALLWKRRLDVAIVDEAGQITEPVCLGPLRLARRFVLVGDQYQLPPLVAEAEAERAGMGTALFSRLAAAHPRAICQLTTQYRMNAEIMDVSNRLVYGGLLRCGSEAQANASLSLPQPHRLPPPSTDAKAWANAREWVVAAHPYRPPATPDALAAALAARTVGSTNSFAPGTTPWLGATRHANWLDECLSTSRRVVFLDTDAMPLVEERSEGARGNVSNGGEARLVAVLVHALLAAGVPAAHLGVISAYRAQLERIRPALSAAFAGGAVSGGDGFHATAPETSSAATAVELMTVDKCQGRDFECVVLSLVRSNGQGDTGSLLTDFRRLNVAFTRAKRKMIIVGSASTVAHSAVLAAFLQLAAQRQWMLPLPPGALQLYAPPPLVVVAPMAPAAATPGLRRSPRRAALAVAADRPITANVLQEVRNRPPTLVPAGRENRPAQQAELPGLPAW